jgi:hypothetical protein
MYIASSDCHSTEEKEIGCWTDGKPLYQKTIDFGTLPNNTVKQVNHGISNLETIANVYGTLYYTGLIYGEMMNPVIAQKKFRTSVRENVVEVSTDDNMSAYSAYVTIQYTKTTDTAGSGQYTPASGKAVHYSTDEQVIGTWIDGSTLYRKTIDIGALPNSATSKSYAHGITGNIVRYDISAIDNSGTVIQLPFYSTANNYNIGVYVTSTNIVVETQRDSSGYTHCYATLEYTKSV